MVLLAHPRTFGPLRHILSATLGPLAIFGKFISALLLVFGGVKIQNAIFNNFVLNVIRSSAQLTWPTLGHALGHHRGFGHSWKFYFGTSFVLSKIWLYLMFLSWTSSDLWPNLHGPLRHILSATLGPLAIIVNSIMALLLVFGGVKIWQNAVFNDFVLNVHRSSAKFTWPTLAHALGHPWGFGHIWKFYFGTSFYLMRCQNMTKCCIYSY